MIAAAGQRRKRRSRKFGEVAYRLTAEPKELVWVWSQPRSGDTLVLADVDGDEWLYLAIRFLGRVALSAASFCGVATDR